MYNKSLRYSTFLYYSKHFTMATRKARVCRLQLTAPFEKLCEAGNISAREVLQRLLDQMRIYAHLAPKNDSEASAAMVLFQQYLHWRTQPYEPHDYLAEHYIRQLLQLVQSDRPEASKTKEQQQIIAKWHAVWWQQSSRDFRLLFSADVQILERLFHISIADFLQFYVNHLSIETITNDVANTNEKLSIFCFMGKGEW